MFALYAQPTQYTMLRSGARAPSVRKPAMTSGRTGSHRAASGDSFRGDEPAETSPDANWGRFRSGQYPIVRRGDDRSFCSHHNTPEMGCIRKLAIAHSSYLYREQLTHEIRWRHLQQRNQRRGVRFKVHRQEHTTQYSQLTST